MKRAALYHRVSTRDQDRTLAREELRQAARQRGYEVTLDVEETGSGARNDRPGLLQVMDAARRGQLDAVLVWKLDRFGRSAIDLLSNVKELQASGVSFAAITQGIEVRPAADAMTGLMLTMLSAFAEFEKALISERTRLGLDKARKKGKTLGRPRKVLPHKAARLRMEEKLSWSELGQRLGCNWQAARRAALAGGAT